jgi:hypothetical protein
MKHLAIIVILIQLLICCGNPKEIKRDNYLNKITSINELLKGNQVNKQVFKLSNNDRRMIIAKNGLKIDFNASNLITEDGSVLGDSIYVEVIECINQADFIKSNVLTISNDKLLVSGGAYNILMFSNGKLLKLKENDSITVYLPRFSEDEMGLFYGSKNSVGQVSWQDANRKLSVDVKPEEMDILEQDTAGSYQYYNPIKIKALDWINCDRFYNQKELTNLDYTIETTQDTLVAKVLLVFKDINSFTSSLFIKSRKNLYNEGFNNLPLDANVRIIAVGIIDNQIFGFYKDMKIQEGLKLKIVLSPMTEEELNDKINGI